MPNYRRLTAAIAMSFQLVMVSVGALSACVDRPHTHGGVAAPDCAMHHQQSQPDPDGMPARHQHHGAHHGTNPAPRSNGVQIGCRCASDLMSYLVSDAAPLPDVASMPSAGFAPTVVSFAHGTIDFALVPTSPPPRPFPV
jgi:hypothetical protein